MESYDVVGTPTERWIWIAPDWSASGSTQKDKSWTHVKVRDVQFKDGRLVTYVLDADGNPVASGGAAAPNYQGAQVLNQSVDKDTADAFKGQQTATKAPNGQQYARGPDGAINEWNPNSNPPGYNIPHPEMSPAGTVYTPEQRAAQASQAQTDASKAAQATEEQRQRVANAALPKDQDPAYETDAERRARGIATAERQRQQTIDAQNAATTAAASRRADSVEARLVAEANKTNSTVTSVTINGERHFTVTQTSPDGKTVKVTNYGPNGQPEASLPTEGRRPLPAGMPALDTSTGAGARQSYLAQATWAQQQVAAGALSQKEAIDLLTPSHQAAQTVIDAEQQGIENARATRTQDITQEGNRLSASTSQFANSRAGVDEAIHYGPKGGTEAGSTWLNNLLIQGLMNQNTKGNTYAPTQASGAAAPAAPLPSPNATSELGQPGDPAQSSVVTPAMVNPTGNAMLDNLVQQARANVGPEKAQQIAASPVFSPKAPVGSPVVVSPGGLGSFVNSGPGTTPPAVQGTPSQVGDTGAPPVGINDPMSLPPMLRSLYGRSILDRILQQQGAVA